MQVEVTALLLWDIQSRIVCAGVITHFCRRQGGTILYASQVDHSTHGVIPTAVGGHFPHAPRGTGRGCQQTERWSDICGYQNGNKVVIPFPRLVHHLQVSEHFLFHGRHLLYMRLIDPIASDQYDNASRAGSPPLLKLNNVNRHRAISRNRVNAGDGNNFSL